MNETVNTMCIQFVKKYNDKKISNVKKISSDNNSYNNNNND